MINGIASCSRAKITQLCQTERFTRLQDIVLHRTLMCFKGVVTLHGLADLTDLVASLLGWDAARAAAEQAQTLELLQGRHRLTIR